ncbi:PREDICTED: uncharacterized protein LOC106329343 isoform X1 [Brassica oleracea var. oleracea]|uniref:uncharacterized protein LOC106329343 isoform X1 n=1 Tax=Brassica oleracea var. oleracea TaxID=109376 RepID=UPI0006A6FE0E|nr:PREDICTED: uncharacterized protein LOC106329343 isoform X1 [Brassica oleracea var. oleracea]XP_013623440.1 PREDICTED: uncharacterized protein LOC106329343 isoform X1 [Brassica oleracea var. oleracea]
MPSKNSQPAAEVSRVDAMEGIKKTELVPIGDLNTYISNSNEQAHVNVKLGCVSPDITGFIRVRAELAVDDRKDSATFVVFNKELTKLIKQDAATLALEEVQFCSYTTFFMRLK